MIASFDLCNNCAIHHFYFRRIGSSRGKRVSWKFKDNQKDNINAVCHLVLSEQTPDI